MQCNPLAPAVVRGVAHAFFVRVSADKIAGAVEVRAVFDGLAARRQTNG